MTARSTSAQLKPLPAFGRELLALRRRGLVPTRHLFVGHVRILLDNWRWGRLYDGLVAKLVIAADANPGALDFSPVAGLDVSVIWSKRYSSPERFAALRDGLQAVSPSGIQVFELDCQPTAERWYVLRRDRTGRWYTVRPKVAP